MSEARTPTNDQSVTPATAFAQCLNEKKWDELRAHVAREPHAALEALASCGFTRALAQQDAAALMIYANLCMRLGKPAAAGWALYYAARKLGGVQALPLPMQNVLFRNHPLWTQDVKGTRVVLARPRAEHMADLVALFKDKSFTSKFNAFLPPPETAAKEFIERTTAQFADNKQFHWLIQTPTGKTTGLISLTGIDFINRRAELQFGFNDEHSDGRARMEAFQLMLYLVFNEIKLTKLCSLVYSSNQPAQDMTLKMGFTQEGTLRKHLLLPGRAHPVDLYINGLLIEDFATSDVIKNHSKLVFKTYDPTQLFELTASASTHA